MSPTMREAGEPLGTGPSPEESESREERVVAAVWRWREGERSGRAHEARAARRQGVVRAAVGLVAAVLIYFFWSPVAAAVVGGIATVLLAIALASPLGLYRRIDGWLARFAHAVGLAVTWLLMPLLYYLVFLPVGLLLRWRGRLRLTRGLDPRASSYWVERGGDAPDAKEHDYRRQF